ncbi:MAG TPA: hypothetical protein VMZ27_13930 [Candidatus Saccharimonadales bacterium]|nr:hypothetical protein [Candidatus Saccharimonadales bacterium]
MVFKKGNTGTKPDSYEDLVGSKGDWPIGKSITEWIDLAWSNNTVQAAATANMEIEGTTS